MNIAKIVGLIFVILFGVFMFVYGGYDDSPGAQGLGLILAIISIVVIVKMWKK
jgi:drug/metabolite transporter (DMT)-like permease